ncbi:transcription termination factor Rho [Amycolatopsis azurea]|uniref:Transcription termination factor Rho n=1 Tax=Amycolatopsis azurea DSM 43854 TaxID=1238180 RepID=M2PYG4_9PSEU|nr:transcription termination factor Rho [Amycolatopsis azurea]EMD29678.1 Transcription termination factor Rho [Amycolatopsis azurea DSM 43854]OOC07505.1 transcription termination factor Rho [Amycolatopsis azurea DSM 43854]
MSNTDLLSDVEGGAAESNGVVAPKRTVGGLTGKTVAELRSIAGELGIGETTGMRKGDLIAAIRERQGKTKRKSPAAASETLPLEGIDAPRKAPKADAPKTEAPKQEAPKAEAPKAETAPAEAPRAEKTEKTEKSSENGAAPAAERPAQQDNGQQDGQSQQEEGGRGRRRRGSNRAAGSPEQGGQQRERGDRGDRGEQGGNRQGNRDGGRDGNRDGGRDGNRDNRGQDNRQRNQQGGGQDNSQRQGQGQQGDDDEEGGRRGRRFRDRRRRGSGGGREQGGSPDTEIREDDVLLPVAGILDVLDNYAFVRTSGYLAGPNDVYVSLSLVRKYGLRRGDAITGVVRQPRDGEQQRQKFNPLVRVDSINGLEPDESKRRPEFTKLTPLYPNERLRLETEPHKLTTRVIDLVMPVGKGQRALIVSPPKAGKTTIMQDIANAISTNNPECHLMVVLVDERPEEVTDMQRSVKGEVIASTFDRPPSDHTSVAELAIERAKRLVEMGHDVVVLLDSITRLGRAYNLAAPASGRILSGGVDSTALFPPKRFLGAARNIENGGSLTIFATTMVETGSTGDTVIFEEFKGTANADLKLDRKIAERRVFPAVDINPSGTRKEDLLLSPDELAVTHKLHRVLHALDSQQAIDLLISRLRKTKTNIEFLMQVSKTALGSNDDD